MVHPASQNPVPQNPTPTPVGTGDAALKPPLQPLNLKKTGLPTNVLIALVLIGFGLAALAFYFLAQLVTGSKDKSKTKAVVTDQIPPSQTVVEVVAPKQEKPAAAPRVLRELPTLTLTGIMYSGEGRENYAILNGKILTEGGMISGAKLERIGPDRVELSFDERRIILRSL
jgi:hypothetical protein